MVIEVIKVKGRKQKQTQEALVKAHWEFYLVCLRRIQYIPDKKCKYINSVDIKDVHSLLSPLSTDLIPLLLVISIGIDQQEQVEKCLISPTIVGGTQFGLFLNTITVVINAPVYLLRMVSAMNCAIRSLTATIATTTTCSGTDVRKSSGNTFARGVDPPWRP